MKRITTCLLLLFTVAIWAQEGAIITMHAVLIEGDTEAFETVQTKYYQKVAQSAVNDGDIAAWNFLRAVRLDGMNDEEEYNYMFVQGNSSVAATLSAKNAFWNNAEKVLSKKEFKELQELQTKFTWKKDVRVMYRIDSGLWMVSSADDYVNSIIQFNFARPANSTAFLQENKELWKPFFHENGSKMNMISWGTGQKIHPTGADWAAVMSWDMFSSLEDLFNYRLGDGINWPADQSNMAEINPDGFYQVATWQWLTGASSN